MTSPQTSQFIGPPPPITALTVEQEFKMRQIKDALENPTTQKEDIITVFLALQTQAFVLGNNISQLVKTWPIHPSIMEATGRSETSS